MELSKNYTPGLIELKWSKHWSEKGYFKSRPEENKKAFAVVIPPPNVTGVLHMGHTLNETVQDILIRRARMSGYNACWVPGSDHASIATEARVVNMLKEKGIDKNHLTREEFLKYAYEWKEKFGGIIYNQIERLGCSVDWDRVTFTMDDHYYKAVIKVFVELYNKGLIYRGARMINWDPSARTALSDEEVEYKEVTGVLYYVKYKIAGSGQSAVAGGQAPTEDFITIATQRPETIMGDTAVCVNPNDDRYVHLRGKKVIVPLVNREVPVIFDEYVDKQFGTGALKITPAHDISDYNIGLKYNLPIIDTLNEDGTLSAAAQVFVGLDRFDARKKAVAQLRNEGLLIKEQDYQTRMGFSQRTSAVVEPRISTQWFVKMKELAGPALNAVLHGDVKIHPAEKFLATYKYWLENVKDWCISRQLWWGQRIPAWYDANGNLYVAETEQEATAQAASNTLRDSDSSSSMPTGSSSQLTQDEDILDTWFSSWLWPIEVFKGITEPDNKDFNYYYPTSVLVTGQDIIFFWVARMIMAGYAFKNQKPFSDVYFTGMVRDKQGRKMSKSLGNSPDLLELINKYGADAVRFGILISSPAGNDLLFDEASLEQGRNFNNKLWNALKLVKMWEERLDSSDSSGDSFAIDWFDNRLNEAKSEINELFADFKLSEALKILYSLIWDDFCSWYLEWAKPGFEQSVSKNVYQRTVYFFEELLQLLHPFMPFVTEEIFHLLKKQTGDLCLRQFNKNIPIANQSISETGHLLKQIITAIRDTRIKNQIKPKETIEISVETENRSMYSKIEIILGKQINATNIIYVNKPVESTITIVSGKDKFYLKTQLPVNVNNQKEDLLKELEYLKGFLVPVVKKLSNEKFVQNAKPEVIELERKKQADAQAKIKALEESLTNL